jgi:hypothetical protein
MSRLWRDPVSSQIIAAGIIALLGFIWAHFDWGSVGTAVPLTVGIVALIAIVFITLYRLWRVSETWRRRFMTALSLWPIIGMFGGALIFLSCAVWLFSDNRATNREIQQALRRYVLPRHLTEQQTAAISGYLLQHDPPKETKVIITVPERDAEAAAYADDIRQALVKGGWPIAPINTANDVQEGLGAQFWQTEQSSKIPADAQHPKLNDLLRQALHAARIEFGNFGGGGGQAITENSLTISVGHRRMDDGDLKGKAMLRERAIRMLKDAEEQD